MKKKIAAVLAVVLVITSILCAGATEWETDANSEIAIEFNGNATGYTSIICNDTYYVPMRKVFEMLGASVFYRGRDRQILALSRDGDVIKHNMCGNVIVVNDVEKEFSNPSVEIDGQTYIPVEMISGAFCPDAVSYDEQKLSIQKYLFDSDYHKVIRDVLDVCRYSNFYPEKFARYINLHNSVPDYSIDEVLYRVNLGFDYPFYENVTTISEPYELQVLVNKYNKLPSGFSQYNLVTMDRKYSSTGTHLLFAGAYEAYVKMADAARKDGISMIVVSAYRTENYQANLYNSRLKTRGRTQADMYTARPGFSEHQTGLAVDINSVSGTFENSAAFRWLQQHAHEYGFILRYPKGKEWITGYGYESWHYRYVGTDAAKIIHDEGITYEEYYAKYVSVNEFK